ncbi:MAG: DNA recombination protein RmuC, partial [Paracoccaceae bacterium]
MIRIGSIQVDFSDPVMIGLAIVGAMLLVLIFAVMRSGRQRDEAAAPMLRQMSALGAALQGLSQGQQQLAGGLQSVSDTQANAQAIMIQTLERRLAEVQKGMSESLHGSSVKTTRSLSELQTRLETIDRAQANIEKLSGNVLSLQDILSNKQARGAFGEIQLNDIVGKALPKDSYELQVTLSNGKRADCLIHLPNPPGPIVIDAKFPLEAYEALRKAADPAQIAEATRQFKTDVRNHIKAISQKYIIEGETADGALMFLPSEAVYA